METDVVIRPLVRSDLPRFMELLKHLDKNLQMDEEKMRDIFWKLRPQSIYVYVAVLNDAIIGTASLDIDTHFIHNGGKVGRIEDVVVAPLYRCVGIGTMLVRRCIEAAKDEACYKVILSCDEDNTLFYELCGFRRHEVSMRLDLPSGDGQGLSEGAEGG